MVGVRLGCLNHALLTVQSVLNDGLPLAGWVANCIDPDMPAMDENIQTLENLIPAPCVGVVPFSNDPLKEIKNNLQMDLLLQHLESIQK